jgi:hypothetical protein
MPWLLWSADLPRTHEHYTARLTPAIIVANLGRGQDIIFTFLSQIYNVTTWGLLWIALVIAALLSLKAFRHRYIQALWLLLIFQVALYMFVYLITPWNLQELFRVSLYRILLHTTPTAIFIIGYHWAAISTSNA